MKNLHIKKTTMLGVFASSLLVAASAVYIYSPTFGSHAAESKEAEINLTVASTLGIRTSADNLNLEASVGSFVHGAIDVDVITNSQYGYTLALEDSDNESSLVHSNSSVSDKLTSTFAGAKTSLQLENNTWGFSLDESNYYFIPTLGNPVALKRTNTVISGDYDRTSVDFGAKVGTIASGTYTDTVKFTAYVNGVDGNPEDGTVVNNPGEIVDKTLAGVIKKMVNTNPSQVVADDPDGNPRYVGQNPDNYVKYNNEDWRIIGVFEDRVKIIRDEEVGYYSWDTTESSINEGLGVNEWSQSKLAAELNGDYLNTSLTENQKWYDGSNLQKTSTFNLSKRLSVSAQSLIDDATWYLGSINNENGYDLPWDDESLIAPYVYEHERGDRAGKTCSSTSIDCNDTVERTTRWTGKVGLIYPSDFLYSTAGGASENRATCLATAYWANHSDCYSNSWLYGDTLYTITPRSHYNWATYVYAISSSGYLYGNYDAAFSQKVRPVVYLKSSVTATSGDGSKSNPYILSII